MEKELELSRLIFVPQYPTKCRYQEWWFTEFPKQFKKHFDEVCVLGESYIERLKRRGTSKRGELKTFAPIYDSIRFEFEQIGELYRIELRKGDTLFLSDLSFPGMFGSYLYHIPYGVKKYAYCHATSLNTLDYFEKDRDSKFLVETGYSKLFDKVFVGSEYHKEKLGWDNVEVIGLPAPTIIKPRGYVNKTFDIVSVCRPNDQKIDIELEKKVEERFGKIKRRMFDDWTEYSRFLSSAKILLISSIEDTFNYTIMDALKCKCFPLAPTRLCFPEILSPLYLYWNEESLYRKIENMLNGKILFHPEMKCQDMVDNFYETLCERMA